MTHAATSTLTTPDGLKLFVKQWLPDTSQPTKAVILLTHGFGEHITRYEHVAAFFNDHQYAVVGADARGHGNSEGQRGHTPSFDAYLSDLQLRMDAVRQQFPSLPIILWGHSMGGNVTLNFLLRRHPDVQSVVVTSPWIQLAFQPPAWKVALAKMMCNIAPTLSQDTKLNADHVSRDPVVVANYKSDPLNHAKMTTAAGAGILQAAKWLDEYDGVIEKPLLIIHGSEDKLISPQAAQAFSQRVKGDVTFKMMEGDFHETHNDPDQLDVFEYALHWLESR